MKIIRTVKEWNDEQMKPTDKSIGFVPTMGALHAGHLSLVNAARSENDIVVASIFVNPTQFNNSSDYANYPLTIENDIRLLKESNCDYLFLPQASEIYPAGDGFRMTETKVSATLCGPTRPGHFDGVSTVVLKLFNIIKPAKAYFGEKDYQQLRLIQEMVKFLFLNIEVKGMPTKRDEFGLALSSRNLRLSPSDLKLAQTIAGIFTTSRSTASARNQIQQFDVKIDYLEEQWGRRFIAYFIGDVRLIDNIATPNTSKTVEAML